MPSPPDWPERPGTAQDFDEFWLVRQLPPEPFPDDYDYGSDRAKFGPPGTRWIFSTESLLNRRTLPGTSTAVKIAIERLIRKLGAKLPPAGSMGWVTPYPLAQPADPVSMPMRYARITINGTIGTDETVSHTLSLRTAPTPDVDQAPADLQTLADQVRDIWTAWLNSSMSNGQTVKHTLPATLTYRDVRAAYLEIPGPAAHPSKNVWTYPKQTYLVPTQYSTFGATVTGTGTGFLPYEAACCISLTSGERGGRNRGRFYLGPLTPLWMGDSGNFDPAQCQALATSFATGVIHAINIGTGCRVHVVSRAYDQSIGVNGVRVGIVPDSQRRRRRSRPETYGAIVGT